MRIIIEDKTGHGRELRRVERAEKRDRKELRRNKEARRGPLAWA